MIVISNRFCAELPSHLNQSLLLLSSRGIGCPKYYILLVLFTLVNTASFSGSYSLHRQPYAAECTGSNFLSVLIFGVYQSWTGVIGFFITFQYQCLIQQRYLSVLMLHELHCTFENSIYFVIFWFQISAERLICIYNDQR